MFYSSNYDLQKYSPLTSVLHLPLTHLSLSYLCILRLFAGKSLLRCFDIRGTQTMELNSWAQGYSQFEEKYIPPIFRDGGDFWNDGTMLCIKGGPPPPRPPSSDTFFVACGRCSDVCGLLMLCGCCSATHQCHRPRATPTTVDGSHMRFSGSVGVIEHA